MNSYKCISCYFLKCHSFVWCLLSPFIIITGSEDKTVRVWSTVSGVVVVCFSDHQDTISQVLITSDNKRILSADFSNYMKLWKAESGEVSKFKDYFI